MTKQQAEWIDPKELHKKILEELGPMRHPPPVYVCDKMAYNLLNDADSLPGLSSWVERQKELGKLWCISNWGGVPGWNEWRPRYLPSDAYNYMIYYLRLLGFSESTPELADSMLTYIYCCSISSSPDPMPLDTQIVFVTGNEEFLDAFTQTEHAVKKVCIFADYFFGGLFAHYDGPERTWPVFRASASDTEPVEEHLDPTYVRGLPSQVEENLSPFIQGPLDSSKDFELLGLPGDDFVRELFSTAKCPLEVHSDGLIFHHQYDRLKRAGRLPSLPSQGREYSTDSTEA